MTSWDSIEDFDAFIAGGGMVEPGDDMPDEYRQAVFRFIETHANSELMGALTERDWIPMAPGVRRKQILMAKTQDEIGHAHLLYMVAADMGLKTRDEMLVDLFEGRSRFHNVFHYQAHTYGDQIAISYLVDAGALINQQAVFKECSYGPYKRMLRRVVAEEGFHMRLGEEHVLTLSDGSAAQRELFQEALDRWWWPVLHMFGAPTNPGDLLMRWKIKSETNEALRDRFVQKFVPLLHSYGFTIPDPDLRFDEGAGRWEIGEIDWEPLKATWKNVGPDTARRLDDARHAWESSGWLRDALAVSPGSSAAA